MPEKRKRKRDGGASSGSSQSSSTSSSSTSSSLSAANKKAIRMRMSRSSVTTRGGTRHLLESKGSLLGVKLDRKQCAQDLVLSSDGKTVTGYKGYRMARATHGVKEGSGAWYFEVLIDRVDGENVYGPDGRGGAHARIGWATSKANVETPVGYDAESFALRDVDGTKVHQSLRQEFSAPYSSGDVIGCYICMANGEQTERILKEKLEEGRPLSSSSLLNGGVRSLSSSLSAGEGESSHDMNSSGGDAPQHAASSRGRGGGRGKGKLRGKGKRKGKGGKNRFLWTEIRFYKNGRLLWGPRTIPVADAIDLVEAREAGRPFEMNLYDALRHDPSSSSSSSSSSLSTGMHGATIQNGEASEEKVSSSSSSSSLVKQSTPHRGMEPRIGQLVRYAFRDIVPSSSRPSLSHFVPSSSTSPSSSSGPSSSLRVTLTSSSLVSSLLVKKSPFFPAISLYGPAEVTFNPGPFFECPPKGLRMPDGRAWMKHPGNESNEDDGEGEEGNDENADQVKGSAPRVAAAAADGGGGGVEGGGGGGGGGGGSGGVSGSGGRGGGEGARSTSAGASHGDTAMDVDDSKSRSRQDAKEGRTNGEEGGRGEGRGGGRGGEGRGGGRGALASATTTAAIGLLACDTNTTKSEGTEGGRKKKRMLRDIVAEIVPCRPISDLVGDGLRL